MTEHEKFKPGVYRHYKGGLYRALMLARDHDSQWLVVVYVPMQRVEPASYPSLPQVRPLLDGPDAWLDDVADGGVMKSRFEWVAP